MKTNLETHIRTDKKLYVDLRTTFQKALDFNTLNSFFVHILELGLNEYKKQTENK